MTREKDVTLGDPQFYDRLEHLLLRGETSPTRLARTFGTTQDVMTGCIKKVYEDWNERRQQSIEEERAQRIEQLNYVLRLTLKEYDESKKPQTEIREEIRPCGFCGGKGKDEVHPGEYVKCQKCHGKGKFTNITTITKERDGNVAYIKLAKETIEAAAKMAGIGQSMSLTALNKAALQAGGEVQEQVQLLQFKGTPDDILGALAAMDTIRNEMNKGNIKTLEQKDNNDADE